MTLVINKIINKIRSSGAALATGTRTPAAGDHPLIQTSKTMGKILQELLNTVLDDPKQNTKEQLLFIAQNIARQYIDCNVSHTKEKL